MVTNKLKNPDGKIPINSRFQNAYAPIKPWTERRAELCKKIQAWCDKNGYNGMPVNIGYFYKTNTQEDSAKDCLRLVKEGYAELSGKTFVRRTLRFTIKARHITLTAKGKRQL